MSIISEILTIEYLLLFFASNSFITLIAYQILYNSNDVFFDINLKKLKYFGIIYFVFFAIYFIAYIIKLRVVMQA